MNNKKKSKPVFTRGYKDVRARIEKYPKFFMSCLNCDYYFKDKGDDVELCQNPNVLQYDMVVEPDRVYCIHWVLFNDHKTKIKPKKTASDYGIFENGRTLRKDEDE